MNEPDPTAARVALWRALHVELDAPPHVIEDVVGLRLLQPEAGWRERPDMHPQWTRRSRASIVARARFIEDLLVAEGVDQYVLLGSGIDTFAQRRPSRIRVFEVDRQGPLAWKRQRLGELGLPIPELVPVDFESGWWEQLTAAGFDPARPAVVASTGVTMYLTREAVAATLRQIAALAPGSTLAMTFMLPAALLEAEERPAREVTERYARAGGTPWISYFTPDEMLTLARESGFREARHVSAADLTERYFAGRDDGLRPSSAEELVVART
jgi:methyltransferase (TIGR00027 family)